MSIVRDNISISLGAGAWRQPGAWGNSAAADSDSKARDQFQAGSSGGRADIAVRFPQSNSASIASPGC